MENLQKKAKEAVSKAQEKTFEEYFEVAEKKIKIFRIPLSMLYRLIFRSEHTKDIYQDKIKMIPEIKAKPSEMSIFKVNIDGDLNSNNLNVKMKNLK